MKAIRMPRLPLNTWRGRGFTLIETIVFLVVVSLALGALVGVYSGSMRGANGNGSADPMMRMRALELAQAQMDAILARKFDENTPTGGVPACDSSAGVACLGISPDADFDDVGDYSGFAGGAAGYPLSVAVVDAGSELGLASNTLARRITITVGLPSGDAVNLSAYKTNY